MVTRARFDQELLAELREKLEHHRPRRKNIDLQAYRGLAGTILKRSDPHALLAGDRARWLRWAEDLLLFVSMRRPDASLVKVSAPFEDEVSSYSVLSTCVPDQPFIVDTIRLCLQHLGVELRDQLNLVVPVERRPNGRLAALGAELGDSSLESIARFEITPQTDVSRRKQLEEEIQARLRLARAMASDFRRMLRRLKDVINQYEFLLSLHPEHREEISEARSFMEWMADDHVVFMGMTELGREGSERLGLHGLRENLLQHSYPESRIYVEQPTAEPPLVLVQKTQEESTVHRRGKIDEILIRIFDERGRASGCLVVHGLFTYRALQSRGGAVPILRGKLQEVVRSEDVTAGSYNYKSIVNAFNALPLEYLFGAGVADIRALIRGSLAAERSRQLEIHLSVGNARRSAFLFVVMPRQNFNDDVRARIQDLLLEQLGANYCDYRVAMSNYGVAILHYYFTSVGQVPDVDLAAIERDVSRISSTWEDRFRDALLEELETDEGLQLFRIYRSAFSQRYQVSTEPQQFVPDVLAIEQVRTDGGLRLRLYRDAEDHEQNTAKLRLYEADNLLLSDIMPTLDNFGLRVVNSFANRVRPAGDRIVYLDTFRFHLDGCEELATNSRRQQDFLAALQAVFDGEMASDALNRVLLPAGLTWSEVDLLRSYQGYSKQLGNLTTPGSLWPVLVAHARIVRQIVDLFYARFGPGSNGRIASRVSPARKRRIRKLRTELMQSIEAVQSYHHDRILRIFANLVESTLRTNFFNGERIHRTIAHKIDCSKVLTMTDPRPWREIYVHHTGLEGVHLRGGRIARGGLRWSDRPDDFRTEIFGLMATQMVKNVVIVPVGAKGGFVLKGASTQPERRRAEADARYEIFIQALLDLTDNMVDGQLVRPRNVLCHDDPDPYLVVAADKGTAHLSDTANRISTERGFWLGDAFASGGSNGYDHKAIGITARGAWVCIRHHLRELGINPEKELFTAIGIGDMGGDVFGNGMLEHDTIRLLAAFNHLHIFIDPDPDPKASFRERRRLFNAKRGGWDAYDPKKISRGGGVFSRQAKSIPLSLQMRKLLGTDETVLSGNQLVHELLKIPVDLWYNGGIGTYVKAMNESHTDAQDPSNDSVRIDASALQAKVVGEGGNLGLTQAARIEYAQAGGRLNTDFIDNAGGVNCSDHEVNLKILLAAELQAGRLTTKVRNRLLREVEPAVTSDVLDANADQALLLSLDERRSRTDLAPFDRVMDEVCRQFNLKRSQLSLPSVRETDRRMAEGEGMTRPELATVSSYVKMQLYRNLVEDPSIEMEGLRPALHNYFPGRVRGRFVKAIDQHQLRREIALSRLTNRIVDHTGATFFHEMQADCSVNARRTLEAYSTLSRAADLWEFKDSLWALDYDVDVETKYDALLAVEQALRSGTRHLLQHWDEERVRGALRVTKPYARKLRALEQDIEQILDPLSMDRVRQRIERSTELGLPRPMAQRLAHLRHLPRALVVLDLAEQSERSARKVGRDYFDLGRTSNLFSVIRWLDELRPRAYYDALAYRSLRREFHELLSRLVLRLLGEKGDARSRLATLGPGADAFSMLERIPPDQMGPAALMVALQGIRQALR